MRSRSLIPPTPVIAAAVFASTALAVTGVVRGSGQEIVDTPRYQELAEAMQSGLVPYRDFDVEYPPGALAAFLLPALAFSSESSYFWAFAALMAACGAVGLLATSAALERLGRAPRRRRVVLALLAFSPLLFGGVLLTRFDLVVAAAVAIATLLVLHGRPRWAAVALGTGAAVKLYPLLMVPLLAVWAWRRFGRREAVFAVALSLGLVALAYAPFAVLSPGGVADSIWRQASRPLQVESLGSGVLVLLHDALDFEVVVETSSGSQNLSGTAADATAVMLTLAAAAALLFLWVGFGREAAADERLVRYAAAVLVAFVAFGKVASPQFLIWLLFPFALVAGRRGVAAGTCFAIAAIATAIWFPWRYFDLPRDLDPFVATLVVLRGLALIVAIAVLAWPRGPVTAPPSSRRLRAGAGG